MSEKRENNDSSRGWQNHTFTFEAFRPTLPLSNFINLFWYYEGPTSPGEMERVLPIGAMQMIIRLGGQTLRVFDPDNLNQHKDFSGSVVSGVHSKPVVLDKTQQDSMIGVHFKPGGSFPFLNFPAGILHNENVCLETLFGRKALDLRDQLIEAKTICHKFRVLEQWLLEVAVCPFEYHQAVSYALRAFELSAYSRSISEIVDRGSLSNKVFIRVFRDQVGLSPKLYCRIQRFQNVLKNIQGEAKPDWTEIALDCGYFDQAHFNHDFKDFSGINPTYYHNCPKDHPHHLPLGE